MDEIRDKVIAIKDSAEFNNSDWWLTFYLTAPAERLESIAARLAPLGAVNLDGAESGFLYPKLPVASEVDSVVRLVLQIRELSDAEGVVALSVDVDTDPDVTRAHFAELVRFETEQS